MALTIGQVAKTAPVNVETIRYSEREGLIPEPPRTVAGYRQYTEDAVRTVRFMKRAQTLGFTLDEVGILLELRVRPGSACRWPASGVPTPAWWEHQLGGLPPERHLDATRFADSARALERGIR